jgi:hypothetical protein
MLKQAILYKNCLPSYFAETSMDERNKFYTDIYWRFDDIIDNNEFNKHSFVSVDSSDNIVGFISIYIDRNSHYVYGLEIIRFSRDSKYDILFAKDLKRFFVMMFTYYKYNKLDFTVCVGSPNEKIYDRFVTKYGGRIVGIKKRNFKLMDGTICDQKMYEILIEDFLKALKGEL